MDPNNTNPSNTPPTGDTPEQTPAPEVTPVAPEAPVEAPAPDAEPAVAPAEPTTVASETTADSSANPFGTQPADSAAPVAPAAAAPSVFSTTTGTPGAPKKSNKKIILIAAIVGGVILLAAVAFVLYTLLMSVSKEDYRDAARQFNQVSSASSALTSDARSLGFASSSESDTTFEESVSESEASITKLNEENEALSKLKAVRVGKGAELYGTFNDKLKAYTANATELVTSVKNLRPALVECNKVSDAADAAARVAALKACSTALSDVKDVPNAQFKTYVDSIAKGYSTYASVYEQISALSNPYGANYEQYKTLRDQMYDVQDDISEASKKFSADLKTRDDELSVKDSADALADYLTEQQK